jgi:ribosomal protein S18 acetylase RimI-like enzyme
MYIERATVVSDELVQAVQSLVPFLGAHKPIPSRDDLSALLASGSSTLFVARFPDTASPIVGMLTLSVYRVPTGIRSIIEDVVVDDAYRKQGIASAMMEHAIAAAREAGASGIALTSNPLRVEANQLYQTLGFQKRDTNAYFYKLE